jgi:hypothetical protein
MHERDIPALCLGARGQAAAPSERAAGRSEGSIARVLAAAMLEASQIVPAPKKDEGAR